MRPGRPAMRKLELEVTYRCGMDCVNCNRVTGLAPGTFQQDVTLAQLRKLVEDSERLNYPWKEWCVLGGDPTLHPDLLEMFEIIDGYRRRRGTGLKVNLCISGAYGSDLRAKLVTDMFPGIEIMNSEKKGPNQKSFTAICDAPADSPDKIARVEPANGCTVSWYCGLGWNYRGFYTCAIAAAIDRVFDLSLGVPELAEVSERNLIQSFKDFCPLCGHLLNERTYGKEIVSDSWQKALEGYAERLRASRS